MSSNGTVVSNTSVSLSFGTPPGDTVATGDNGRKRKLISVVIPAYNEDGNIASLEERVTKVADSCKNYDFEFIVVDNASTDKTGQMIKDLCQKDSRWKYIRFSRNFLVESSISAGYRHSAGEAMIVIYSDLQEPPELIPELLAKWEEGYDVVYGVHTKREGEAGLLTLVVKLAYRLVRWSSEVEIPTDSGDFRLISAQVRDALEQCEEYHRYTRGLIAWLGFSQVGIRYVRQPRTVGKSKSPLSVYFAYFVNAITTFSMKPLRLFFFLGAALMALSMLALLVVAIAWTPLGTIAPALLVSSVVMFACGLNSLGLGVVGEYVGRTYTQVRQRPRYIIQEKMNVEAVVYAGNA